MSGSFFLADDRWRGPSRMPRRQAAGLLLASLLLLAGLALALLVAPAGHGSVTKPGPRRYPPAYRAPVVPAACGFCTAAGVASVRHQAGR